MKVICAGFQKTGTKSLGRALEELDLKVYDASETYIYMRKAWMDYFAGRITIQDVCRQYDEAGVDAIVDGPGNYFWHEMMEYWPKAKVILTVRDNEDKWYASMLAFYIGTVKWVGKLAYFGYLTPLGVGTAYGLTIPYHRMMFGHANFHPLVQDFDNVNNEVLLKKRYREHNQLVRANVDKSRFLEMNVKEGWKPLCQFLNRPTPDREFPFRNKSGKEGQTGEFLDDIMEPYIKRCKMEVGISLTLLIIIPALILSYYFRTVEQ